MSAGQLTALILPNARALGVGNGRAALRPGGRGPEYGVVDVATFFAFASSKRPRVGLGKSGQAGRSNAALV